MTEKQEALINLVANKLSKHFQEMGVYSEQATAVGVCDGPHIYKEHAQLTDAHWWYELLQRPEKILRVFKLYNDVMQSLADEPGADYYRHPSGL